MQGADPRYCLVLARPLKSHRPEELIVQRVDQGSAPPDRVDDARVVGMRRRPSDHRSVHPSFAPPCLGQVADALESAMRPARESFRLPGPLTGALSQSEGIRPLADRRLSNVVDVFTRECLAIHAGRKLSGVVVSKVLD